MEKKKGVTETRQLTPLQWQLMMKCWKMNLRPGQYSWWGPTAWRLGAIGLWVWKLRKLNGPNFTWPLLCSPARCPNRLMAKMGKIYMGKPIKMKTRKELLETIKPAMRQLPPRGHAATSRTTISSPPQETPRRKRLFIELTPSIQ